MVGAKLEWRRERDELSNLSFDRFRAGDTLDDDRKHHKLCRHGRDSGHPLLLQDHCRHAARRRRGLHRSERDPALATSRTEESDRSSPFIGRSPGLDGPATAGPFHLSRARRDATTVTTRCRRCVAGCVPHSKRTRGVVEGFDANVVAAFNGPSSTGLSGRQERGANRGSRAPGAGPRRAEPDMTGVGEQAVEVSAWARSRSNDSAASLSTTSSVGMVTGRRIPRVRRIIARPPDHPAPAGRA